MIHNVRGAGFLLRRPVLCRAAPHASALWRSGSMIWAELVRSTTFRRALMLALALAAVIVALFGFVYWKTDNYLTARSDQMIMTQLNAISLLSDQRLMDAIDAHLKQDSRGVQFAGLFRSDGSRMAGNIVEMPPDLKIGTPAQRVEIMGIR